MDNHNRMWHYSLVLNKYWVTYSDYSIIATTVTLGVGIKYSKLFFYTNNSEKSKDKKVSMR